MNKMELLIEMWSRAGDYQIECKHREMRGVSIVVLEEISHMEVPTRGRPDHVMGPRMRVEFDVILMATGIDYDGALANAWVKSVAWLKPKVRDDSTIMSLIRAGESS